MNPWDDEQPPFGPPVHWERERPTWVDRWWWVPAAVLGAWLTGPTWLAAVSTGGWPRALAIAAAVCVLAGFCNLTRRRRWFRHHHHHQKGDRC